MDLNPYAPTTFTELGPSAYAAGDAEVVRQKYIGHEANIQGIGGLYLLGAIIGFIGISLFLVTSILLLLRSGAAAPSATELGLLGFVGTIGLAMFLLQGYADWSMRKLNPKGKPFAVVVACFGLLGFPLGTLFSAWILWMLLSEKGSVVFSPEYRAVIEATPHVRYRTSIVAWVLLGLILLFVGFAVAAVLWGV